LFPEGMKASGIYRGKFQRRSDEFWCTS